MRAKNVLIASNVPENGLSFVYIGEKRASKKSIKMSINVHAKNTLIFIVFQSVCFIYEKRTSRKHQFNEKNIANYFKSKCFASKEAPTFIELYSDCTKHTHTITSQ